MINESPNSNREIAQKLEKVEHRMDNMEKSLESMHRKVDKLFEVGIYLHYTEIILFKKLSLFVVIFPFLPYKIIENSSTFYKYLKKK